MGICVSMETDGSGNVAMDSAYLRSIDGLLKIGVIASSLIGVICSTFAYNVASGFFDFHTGAAICCSLSLLGFYFFKLVYRLRVRLSPAVVRSLYLLRLNYHFKARLSPSVARSRCWDSAFLNCRHQLIDNFIKIFPL